MGRLFPLVLAILLGSGCHRSDDHSRSSDASNQSAASEGEVPGPKDSLAFRFIRLVPSDLGGMAGEFRITNHFSKDIMHVFVDLNYLDENGKEIGFFPWSFSWAGKTPLGPNRTIIHKLGADIPENTANVQVTVRSCEFRDGTEWKPSEKSAGLKGGNYP
jgi:hypothetical protein